jgi:hypothetical protein
MSTILMLSFIALMAIGLPIAFAMALAAVVTVASHNSSARTAIRCSPSRSSSWPATS